MLSRVTVLRSIYRLITKKVSFRDAEAAFHEVKSSKGIKTLIEGVQDDAPVSTPN